MNFLPTAMGSVEKGETQAIIQQDVVPPPTNKILSWISCICCFPLGLVAVIKATEADKQKKGGDLDNARRSGQVAKYWAIAALVVGFLILGPILGYAIFMIALYSSGYDPS